MTVVLPLVDNSIVQRSVKHNDEAMKSFNLIINHVEKQQEFDI